MPSEIRYILFQRPEVVEAIGTYFRKVGRAVPPGVITDCGPERCGAGSPARFSITIEDEAGQPDDAMRLPDFPRKLRLTVDGADLAAALILYCRAQKIPLPASATKSLEVYRGQLCLAFCKTAHAAISPVRRARL